MKVITLHKEDFETACKELESMVRRSFAPDLVIGIANGGVNVAELIFGGVGHVVVKLQRPGTQTKEKISLVMRCIKRMPEPVKNCLRMFESSLLSLRKPVKRDSKNIEIDIPASSRRILIVDDAVDSGVTMLAVVEAVKKLAPDADIRTCAITCTTPQPLLTPDYFLYNNRTLIRFPWSNDYRRVK